MSGKIYWTKTGTENDCDMEREPPYPSFNLLRDRIQHNAARYVNFVMMDSALNLYDAAADEILELMNEQSKTIREQRTKITGLEWEIKILERKLRKWEEQQKKGRRISKKVKAINDDVNMLHTEGVPKREIARRMGVSEGTIRRILKKGVSYQPTV